MSAITTRRQRFLPYRYDEHGLSLGFVRCRLDGLREAGGFDKDTRILDLSGTRFGTAILRVTVSLDARLLEAAFPADERLRPVGRLLVVVTCTATRLRRAIVLTDGVLAGGTVQGDIELRSRDLFGGVELEPVLVRTADRGDAEDGHASAAWTRLAAGRGMQVRCDAARPLNGEYLDVRYESFREKGVLQFPSPDALYQLDCDGDAPLLWLNTDHQAVCTVLEAQGTVGRAARMRDVLFSQISLVIWTRLFWRTARDVRETGETVHEWQDAVLGKFMHKLYPEAPNYESRVAALVEELRQGQDDELLGRLDLVLQDDVELATRAASLAEELG
jgi:hypothetical protein